MRAIYVSNGRANERKIRSMGTEDKHVDPVKTALVDVKLID